MFLAAFLFVGLEIKYEKIETFSESFKTQLSFPSRSWRPFDSIEVVGFSPCLNLGSVSGLTKEVFLSGYKTNAYY